MAGRNAVRVLIVEDLPESRRSFSRTLVRAGFIVETAATLPEALEHVENRTFHVAVVDLSLIPGDSANRDGLLVLRRLHELDEGTGCIVLSAFKDLEVAVEGYEKLGLVKYLVKRRENGIKGKLVEAVSEVAAEVSLRELNGRESLVEVLSGTAGAELLSWEHRALEALKPAEGIEGFRGFLARLTRDLLPIVPRKDRRGAPLELDSHAPSLVGRFWSKSLGVAIRLKVCPEVLASEILYAEESTGDGTLVTSCKRNGLAGVVAEEPGTKRMEYGDAS